MAIITGMAGRVKIGAAEVLNVESWEGNFEVAMLDNTYIGDTAEGVTPGLFKGSVKITLAFNYGDTTGQKVVHDAFFAKTSGSFVLETDRSGSVNKYTGTAYVAKLGTKVSKGTKTMLSLDVTFSGAVTYS